jgi:hypothetical protein
VIFVVFALLASYLGRLPFLWLSIEDEPGPGSLRGLIERNLIALASGLHEPVVDPPLPSWLGLYSGRDKVRRSWPVDENYVPSFLDMLEAAIERNRRLIAL